MPLSLDLAASGNFSLTDESGHTIEVLNNIQGLQFIHSLLMARKTIPVHKIATPSRPLQSMVDIMLRQQVKKHKSQKPASRPAICFSNFEISL
jgi:hypothetical protein